MGCVTPNLVAHHQSCSFLLFPSIFSISTAIPPPLSAQTLPKTLHMSSGRPKGSKNKANHSAGGARAGSGRKKHDITSSAISQATATVQPGKLFF